MSIFREWDTRFFDNRVMEGIYFEQDKDRKHYAEVEAKHAAEVAYVEKWRAHWEAMYNTASKERDEARAELAKLKQPAFITYSPFGELPPIAQRPIARNEYDRRISRLEAKVANLELGHAR